MSEAMTLQEYQETDTTELDRELLDEHGRLRALLPAADLLRFGPRRLKVWCHRRARYGLPTRELVDWLRHRIGGRSAIEVGAGNGDLGYLLGIPETDSYLQQRADVKLLYRFACQSPCTDPAASVQRDDALGAVEAHRPAVVVASWLTQKFSYLMGDREGTAQASVYGVDEVALLSRVQTYIHIGHVAQHGRKRLLAHTHEAVHLDGLLSRAADQAGNVIYIWNNPGYIS